MMSPEELFKKNLLKYQKGLSDSITKYCIIGGILGVSFYCFMKFIGIMDAFSTKTLLLFSIPVSSGIVVITTAYFILRKREIHTYVRIMKYVIVTVGNLNLFAIFTFVPYRDTWGCVILLFFISSFYLEMPLVIYGNLLSSILAFLSLYLNSYDVQSIITLGDITTRIQVVSFGALASCISTLMGRRLLLQSSNNEYNSLNSLNDLQMVVDKVKETSDSLKVSSGYITILSKQQTESAEATAENTQDVMEGTFKTSDSVNQCDELIKSLTADIEMLKGEVERSYQNSENLKRAAGQGSTSMDEAVKMMTIIKESALLTSQSAKDLDLKAKQIDNIVSSIQGIAKQTNLLSLNASIEAARAGEYGNGFAVVASEIRVLAEESKKSLDAITATLKDIFQHGSKVDDLVLKVDEGVNIIKTSKECYQSIINDLSATFDSLCSIKEISNNQLVYSKEVGEFMDQVNHIASQTSQNVEATSAATEQALASSEELLNYAQQLDDTAVQLNNMVSAI